MERERVADPSSVTDDRQFGVSPIANETNMICNLYSVLQMQRMKSIK